jgi:hypothetical protein
MEKTIGPQIAINKEAYYDSNDKSNIKFIIDKITLTIKITRHKAEYIIKNMLDADCIQVNESTIHVNTTLDMEEIAKKLIVRTFSDFQDWQIEEIIECDLSNLTKPQENNNDRFTHTSQNNDEIKIVCVMKEIDFSTLLKSFCKSEELSNWVARNKVILLDEEE